MTYLRVLLQSEKSLAYCKWAFFCVSSCEFMFSLAVSEICVQSLKRSHLVWWKCFELPLVPYLSWNVLFGHYLPSQPALFISDCTIFVVIKKTNLLPSFPKIKENKVQENLELVFDCFTVSHWRLQLYPQQINLMKLAVEPWNNESGNEMSKPAVVKLKKAVQVIDIKSPNRNLSCFQDY